MDQREILFEQKYDLYYQMVFNIAYAYTKDYNDAEDILQDSFLAFYYANKNFATLNDEKYYLIRIVINNSKTMLKRKKRYTGLSKVGLDSLISEEVVDNDKLLSMIQVLKPIYKEIIILKFIEDMNNSEISAALDISETNVRKRYERAIKTLRIHWSDYYED